MVLDRADRVECVHPALQHERETVAALVAQLLAVEVGDVDAVEGDPAAVEARGWALHAGQRVAQGRLAAAGFADQADEFACGEVEIDVAHRPDARAAVRFVHDVDAACRQQGSGLGHAAFSRSRGFDSASIPKLISVNDSASSAIARPGAKTISHWPVSSAFCCCAW